MKERCQVCRGSRVIRLPLYRPVSAAKFDHNAAVSIEETSRQYPCPECGDQVHRDRVAVLDAHSVVSVEIDDPEFQRHAREASAHQLVSLLLRDGFIAFEYGDADTFQMTKPLIATIGVISQGQVATMEERVAERQEQVAKAVVQEAIKQIDNWGSHYGHAEILKRDARRLIGEALTHVGKTWSRVRGLAS